MKVAIYGGSFNPITLGHIEIMKKVLALNLYNSLWVMPAYNHVFNKKLEDFSYRVNMCQMVADNLDKRIVVSRFEAKNNYKGSTYSLYKKLKKRWPETEFTFVIGSDNANEIEKWINHEKLINEVKFIVVARYGYKINNNMWYGKKPHIIIDEKTTNISATELRKLLKEYYETQQRILNHITPDIFDYITTNNLY